MVKTGKTGVRVDRPLRDTPGLQCGTIPPWTESRTAWRRVAYIVGIDTHKQNSAEQRRDMLSRTNRAVQTQ